VGVIPVKPSKKFAERIGNWFLGPVFSQDPTFQQIAEELDTADSAAGVSNFNISSCSA
jgi:hypothetical protein